MSPVSVAGGADNIGGLTVVALTWRCFTVFAALFPDSATTAGATGFTTGAVFSSSAAFTGSSRDAEPALAFPDGASEALPDCAATCDEAESVGTRFDAACFVNVVSAEVSPAPDDPAAGLRMAPR